MVWYSSALQVSSNLQCLFTDDATASYRGDSLVTKERWNGLRMPRPCAVEVHVSCCPTANLLTKSIKRENSTAQGRGISEDSVAV